MALPDQSDTGRCPGCGGLRDGGLRCAECSRSMRQQEALRVNSFSPNSVTFSDERHRESKDIEPPYFASVTLDDGDCSWGEFFSREDVERLHSWCARLLDVPYAAGRKLDIK